MKKKDYDTYIEILIKNFNRVILNKDDSKIKPLWDTAKFFLDKKNVPEKLIEVVYLMDRFFKSYYKDPVSNETIALLKKIKEAA